MDGAALEAGTVKVMKGYCESQRATYTEKVGDVMRGLELKVVTLS